MSIFSDTLDLPLSKLKVGKHTFKYTIDNDFFLPLDFSAIQQGNFSIDLVLEKKTELLFMTEIKVIGKAIFPCDYCAEPLELPIQDQEFLQIELSETCLTADEHPEGIWHLPANTYSVNLGQWIYEIIASNVPFRRVHDFDCRKETEDPSLKLDKRWDKLQDFLPS